MLDDKIPLKFQRYAGVRDHRFFVLEIDRHTTSTFRDDADVPYRVPVAVACKVRRYETPQRVLVAQGCAPDIFEALLLLARIDGETARLERYIQVHRAYEAVVANRTAEYSAVRHALAHSVTSLSHPPTLLSLERLFGGPRIDLLYYRHQKEFYRCMGGMLIEIDDTLRQSMLRRWSAWHVVQESREPSAPQPQLFDDSGLA